MSHTPGPWVVYNRFGQTLIKDSQGRPLCEMLYLYTGNKRSEVENEANLSLIEAAPNLLDRLEKLVLFIETYLPGQVNQELIDSCMAEIKKARGEA